MLLDKIKYLLLFILIGGLVGLTTYRLAVEGKIPLKIDPTVQTEITKEERKIVDEESAVISVVEKTSPSVVAIGVTQRTINPFDPFAIPRSKDNTIGTGFIVSEKGVIVTNRHVVSDTNVKYSVVTKDSKKLEIVKIYRDPNLDLAILQVSGEDLKGLDLGDSSKLKVGQTVIAIGNALGRFENTVTTGVVSGLGRAVVAGDPFLGETERLDNLIQTDAAINPGNSGGPLLNSSGQVVGVNVATTEGAQNIGFAIPINSVKALVDEFVANGSIQRAFLGIRYRLITRDVAILNEVPQGAYVQEVVEGSPADKAGLLAGDIITKIDGKQVNSETAIPEQIQKKKVGESVTLEVWSDSKTKTITANLTQAPG